MAVVVVMGERFREREIEIRRPGMNVGEINQGTSMTHVILLFHHFLR